MRRKEILDLQPIPLFGQRASPSHGNFFSFVLVNGAWGWTTPLPISPKVKMVFFFVVKR
jgi:hypothetical protein